MSFQRDLVWQNHDLMCRSSIANKFARYGLSLNYELLPQDVVHEAKRCVLDALACALGAYEAPGRLICEDVAKELGGVTEATVFGSGLRTSALNATLVNSFMVRFLDYNDMGGGGHNSDSIPAILAVYEREKAGGRDFITSVVISYELGARVLEAFTGKQLSERGWDRDFRAGLTMPPAFGKAMGLNEDQIANAIGSSLCGNFLVLILDTHGEEFVMRKNLRFGWGAYAAILYCMLAKKGFTGPVRIVEGENGWRQVIAQGDMDLERLVDFNGWRIMNVRHKYLCATSTLHGQIYATLAIVKEQDLKPDDIAAVRIKVNAQQERENRASLIKYPRSAEGADHSPFYANAIAIKERAFGPDSIKPENFTDPVVLDLIEKTTVEADPSLPERAGRGAAAISEILTKDGRRFQKRVDIPHGFRDDSLTDKELEEKFAEIATKHMSGKQIKQIFNTVWNVEKLDDVGKLMQLMVFPSR
jgi:2-methylcitrate dehydratase